MDYRDQADIQKERYGRASAIAEKITIVYPTKESGFLAILMTAFGLLDWTLKKSGLPAP